ncbi:hypothetical protein CMASS_04835 [Corynebacterium massiliense DSM 45435]|uniref:Uncharacterized protein n=1 Tax=Corynebacterium massiliense DSM 45435 TaxID=1121364 RepID=A0ABY7U8X1_9CORY|nr:hypothetical protein CMASS_04835 [Corynebacterium massiliense DSM 45435]
MEANVLIIGDMADKSAAAEAKYDCNACCPFIEFTHSLTCDKKTRKLNPPFIFTDPAALSIPEKIPLICPSEMG